MNQHLKNLTIGLLGRARCFPTRPTARADLVELMSALRPWQPPSALVRLGPSGDGGYLVPDDLEGIVGCFSPGVNTESGFELACAERGMRVFMADRSVDGPAARHPLFDFRRSHVGSFSEDGVLSMDDWVSSAATLPPGDLLLQMDIEGAEVETLLGTSTALLSRFRIIVLEFHALNELFGQAWFGVARNVFRKLLAHHACVHIHPNNVYPAVSSMGLTIPPYMEFTFLRRDRMGRQQWTPATQFPHPLDSSNVARPPLVLPGCWFSGSA